MATIIDGKAVAERLRSQIKNDGDNLTQQGIKPGLAVIIVGEEEFKPTSIIYPEYKDTLVASGVVDLKKFNAPDFAKVKRISELLQRVNVKSYNLEK